MSLFALVGIRFKAEGISQFVATTTIAKNAIRSIGKDAKAATNPTIQLGREISNMGRSALTAGTALTFLATVPLLAGLSASKNAAVDFEQTLTKINTLAGASEAQIGEFRQGILKLAPAVGKTATELADAAFYIVSGNVRETAAAMDLLEQSARASALGLGTTKTIAQATTSVMNAYGLETYTAAEATDILVAAVQRGKFEASELAPAIGKTLGLASEMGVSFEEVTAFISTFTLSGVSASEATNALGRTLATIIKPSKQARAALEEAGLSVEELRDIIARRGLTAALLEVEHRFDEAGLELADFFSRITGLRGVLFNTGASAADFAHNLKLISESAGITENGFATVTRTTRFMLDQFKASLNVVAIAIGQALLPALNELLRAIIPLAVGFAKFAEANPGIIKLSVALAGLVAAVGPVLIIFGFVSNALGGIVTLIGRVSAGTLGAVGAFAKFNAALRIVALPATALGQALVFPAKMLATIATNAIAARFGLSKIAGGTAASSAGMYNFGVATHMGAGGLFNFSGASFAAAAALTVLKAALFGVFALLAVVVVASIDDMNRHLNEGMGDMAENADDYGEATSTSWAVGFIRGLTQVLSAINEMAAQIRYLMQPGSPPRFLPDIDDWGTETMNTYLRGFTKADFGMFNELTDIFERILRADSRKQQDIGLIPNILNVSDAVARVVGEINRIGTESGPTIADVAAEFGRTGSIVNGLVTTMIKLRMATEEVARAEQQIVDIEAAYERAVSPYKKRLAEIQAFRDEVSRGQRMEELNAVLIDPFAPDIAKTLASMEIEEIGLLKLVDEEEAKRDSALETANERLETAQREVTALQEQLDVLKSLIDAQIKYHGLIFDQKELLDAIANAMSDIGKKAKASLGSFGSGLGRFGVDLQEAGRHVQTLFERLTDINDLMNPKTKSKGSRPKDFEDTQAYLDQQDLARNIEYLLSQGFSADDARALAERYAASTFDTFYEYLRAAELRERKALTEDFQSAPGEISKSWQTAFGNFAIPQAPALGSLAIDDLDLSGFTDIAAAGQVFNEMDLSGIGEFSTAMGELTAVWTDLQDNVGAIMASPFMQFLGKLIGIFSWAGPTKVLTGLLNFIKSFFTDMEGTSAAWMADWNSFIDNMREGWGGFWDQFDFDGFREKWNTGWSTWIDNVREDWKKFWGKVGTWIVEGVWEGIKEGWASFVQKIKDFFAGTPNDANEAIGANSPATAFYPVGHNIIDGVIEGLKERWQALRDQWTGFKENTMLIVRVWALELRIKFMTLFALLKAITITKLTETYEKFSNFWRMLKTRVAVALILLPMKIREIWSTIKSEAETKWEEIRVLWEGLWDRLRRFIIEITSGDQSFSSAVQGLIDAIGDIFDAAWQTFVTIGSTIVDGLISGIQKKADEFWTELGSLITGGDAAARAAGEMRSPSKLYARVGRDVGLGLLVGLDSVMGAFTSRVASAISTPIQAGEIMMPAYLSAQTAGYNGPAATFGDTYINNGMDQRAFESRVNQLIDRRVGART
jgi:TP901 family phage tail tape measure protein